MSKVKDILSNIPPIQERKLPIKDSYIIIGKPSAGKTALATKLAGFTRAQLINLEESIAEITKQGENIPVNEQELLLRSGNSLSGEVLYENMKLKLQDDASQSKGFILDGVPMLLENTDGPAQINFLVSLVQNLQRHNYVVIDLRISDEDLTRRKASQWIDPLTNISYPGQQVLYSRKRRHDGFIDGDEDTVQNEELSLIYGKLNQQLKEGVDGQEDEEKDESEDESGPQQSRPYLKNRSSYPILSEKILDRLIKLPENDPEVFKLELAKYTAFEQKIELFKKNNFNSLQIIELDATMHPDVLFDQLKIRMEARGFSVYNPIVDAMPLVGPEGGFKGIVESDIFKYYCSLNVKDNEPPRDLSEFGKYCPVAYYTEKKLVETTMEYAAVYRGKIYYFASLESQTKFINYPDKYISVKLELPAFNACVIGSPLSGKTTISKCLCEMYNLAYISADEFIENIDKVKLQDLSPKLKLIASKVISQIRIGEVVSEDVRADIIKLLIEENDGLKTKAKKGWIIDGFPANANQLNAMLSAEITPTYLYCINSGTTIFNLDTVEDEIAKKAEEMVPSKLTKYASTWKEAAVPYIEKLFAIYNSESIEVLKVCTEKAIPTSSFKWKPDGTALLNSILASLDPFIPQATVYASRTSVEGSPDLLGATKDFCPVSLKTRGKLLKGDNSVCASYVGFVYYFVNEEARSKFIAQPYSYVKSVTIPPPRLMFLGNTGSGKTSIIAKLSKIWDIPALEFNTIAREIAKAVSQEFYDEMEAYLTENAGLPTDTLKTIITYLYKKEPYASKGFLLEGFPSNKADLDTITKHFIFPDAFVFLKSESEIAAKRKLPFKVKELDFLEQKRLEELKLIPAEEFDPESEKNISLLVPEEKIMEDLMTKVEQENIQLTDFQNSLESLGVVPVIPVSTSRCFRPTMATIDERKLCPVALKKSKKPALSNFGSIPVVYKDEVYFLKNKQNEQEFTRNTIQYIFTSAPEPILSPTCCIVGNPKSGKTTLAKALEASLDCVHLTVSSILQGILDAQEVTTVHDKIKAGLESGKELPDQVVVDAVILTTNRIVAAGKGWILDGYPTTMPQAMALERAGFQPHIFLNLTIDDQEVAKRAYDDYRQELRTGTENPHLNIPEINQLRSEHYRNHIMSIKNLYNLKFSNWTDLTGEKSKWSLKEEVIALSEKALARRQTYLDLILKGKAAAVGGVGLSNSYLASHRGKFGVYCPYSFTANNELRVPENTYEFMAEYKGQFYSMYSNDALQQFLEEPEKYLAKSLPSALPARRSKDELKLLFPKQIQLKGYCPVTFKEGPPGFNSIIPGSQEYVVEYDDNLYNMANLEKMEKFMRTPWEYANLKLPMKLPPPDAPLPITGLPIVGYLEQTIASSLTKALISVGNFKPKFPFKDVNCSANEFVALYLKGKSGIYVANNPRSKDWIKQSYNKKLDIFKEKCELMQRLTKKIKTVNEQSRYINEEFAKEVGEFLKLKPLNYE
ncbi:adenylate kinase [Boothiomyces sp. JEL0838]|nr:adenylate kinase [Boothiomyces sp. JEL0838]